MQQMATILNKQQQLLSQQQLMLNSQQQELSEMKGMLKLLVNQKRPALGESQVAASDTTDHEDLKVFMQLLQKSALSQFSKASKDFHKSCSIFSYSICCYKTSCCFYNRSSFEDKNWRGL